MWDLNEPPKEDDSNQKCGCKIFGVWLMDDAHSQPATRQFFPENVASELELTPDDGVATWPVASTSSLSSSSSSSSLSLSLSSSSSSSSSRVQWKYDVFLSFRGADTRRGITSYLYDRLRRRGIKTFMDDPELQVGDVISPSLLKAIEESRFAIVVLSENFAHSSWCLEELAKICECMEESNRIFPLFYNVEPSDVRYRTKSFSQAFNKHDSYGRHTSHNVQRWNEALSKVSYFIGWHTKNYKTDKELVKVIVDFVCNKVLPIDTEFTMSTEDFEAYEAPRKAMDEVMKLKDDEVTAVGVCGTGGLGKTNRVKHVAAQSCKSGTSHHVIMAALSQSLDLTKIQGTSAEPSRYCTAKSNSSPSVGIKGVLPPSMVRVPVMDNGCSNGEKVMSSFPPLLMGYDEYQLSPPNSASPSPSPPTYLSGRNFSPMQTRIRPETAPVSIPNPMGGKGSGYLSPNFSDPSRNSLPPLSPRSTRHETSSQESPSVIRAFRKLDGSRIGDMHPGSQKLKDSKDDSGRFSGLLSSSGSPRVGFSRSSRRLSFQDDIDDCEFSCPFDVYEFLWPFDVYDVDTTDFHASPSLDGRRASDITSQSLPIGRKSPGAAVGVLVDMLRTAPPLRQDSSCYSSHSMKPEHEEGVSTASGFFMPRKISDALDELKSYREMKDLLISKGGMRVLTKEEA